jgi:hypothetical protein
MILGNTAVVVQDMLCKTPKAFDAVDVIFRPLVDKMFSVLDPVVLAQAFERIVAPEFVGKVHRSFPRFLPNDGHEVLGRDVLHDPRIHPSVALQKAENDAFAPSTPPALSLPPAAKIALVQFDLAGQFSSFKFGDVVDRLSHFLVDAGHRVITETEIVRDAIRRLLEVETLHDLKLSLQARKTLLLQTKSALHVSAPRPRRLERTAENALPPSLKVGRTTENSVLPLCHMDILSPYGYVSA